LRLKGEEEDELKAWEAKASIKVEANREGRRGIEERARTLTGKRRRAREWRLQVARYKKWRQHKFHMTCW